MIFINPWASYNPDDIPDLTPRDDDEARGCICGVCGYIIASAIFVWLMHFTLNFRLNGIISTDVYFILMLITCVIIYPILTIILMKLSFKIGDKIVTRESIKDDKYKHLIPCWSLAALLGVLPISLDTLGGKKWIAMIPRDGEMMGEIEDNPIDACYELILKLHEQKLI